MQRVLHINDYPPETGGGAEVVMGRTMALLQSAGLVVGSFTSADLPARRRTPLRYLNNAVARARLADKLQSFHPDVIHLHNFYHVLSPGILAAVRRYQKQRAVRVVMTAHDYHLVCPNSGGNWFGILGGHGGYFDPERIHSWSYRLSRRWDQRSTLHCILKLVQHAWNYGSRRRQRTLDRILCPSRLTCDIYSALGFPTTLLPHPLPPATSRAVRTGPLRLVFAGRLEPEKGLDEFLQFIPADFEGSLQVIGDGRDADRCRRTCRRRGIGDRVHFRGRLPHEHTLAEIARSHVLVFPSRALETYGLVLIEALSVGTNLLAADHGVAREVITDSGVGFVYRPDEPNSIGRQLEEIVRQFKVGTLNHFDVRACLRDRDERHYLQRLLHVYQPPLAACA